MRAAIGITIRMIIIIIIIIIMMIMIIRRTFRSRACEIMGIKAS